MYNIVVFAHNEEQHIETCLNSILKNVDDNLGTVFLLANGCTDSTIDVAAAFASKHKFENLQVINIEVADKCNAWNEYVHNIADNVDAHIMVDSDVEYSPSCFPKLADICKNASTETNVVAGMPLSGRNLEFYQHLVKQRSCFFGNLYAMTNSYVLRLKKSHFRLPIGLNWIDSFLTKAANTDLTFGTENLSNRVVFDESIGFYFDSLSPFKWGDIKLYKNRIARYELGKIQEVYLGKIPFNQWPNTMNEINKDIQKNFSIVTKDLSNVKQYLVKNRLKKLLTNA